MLIAHYRHRLPADYDLARIRARIAARGPSWDDAPGLVFKAFVLGDHAAGAEATAYGSLYLWRDVAAAADFLTGPGFANVVASFGRPEVETWLPLAVDLGPAASARTVVRSDRALRAGADPGAERRAEAERSRRRAEGADVLATLVGVDPTGWRLTRFTLAAQTAEDAEHVCGDIVHLAAPGLAALRDRRP